MAGLQKILLVEDNTQLRDMYDLILRDHGYQLAVASDGEEALQKATEFSPDLVFLDIMIPKLNGLEVLRRLRHDTAYNSTRSKIVLLTNLSSESGVSQGWENDADGYVVKAEIVPTDLFEIIKSLEGEPTNNAPTAPNLGPANPSQSPAAPAAATPDPAPSTPPSTPSDPAASASPADQGSTQPPFAA